MIYSKKDGTVIWQNDNTLSLPGDIKVTSVKFKPNRYVLVYYPQLEGLKNSSAQDKINSSIKSLFTDARTELKEEDYLSVDDSYHVELLNNLLIVERTGYDYPFGAAHGMPLMDYYYFDITTGDSFELKDLFKEGSGFKEKINEIIKGDIDAQAKLGDSMLFPDSFKGITDNQCFIIAKDTLTIYFYPYDIAAYAAGFPEFTIPFNDLSEYLNMDGAFWLSFR